MSTQDGRPAPRWLTDDEQAAWRSLVSAVAEATWALDDQLQRVAGLSFIEYTALAMLSDAPDRTLRMSHLARLTHASLSRLSYLVQRLESRGLVTRHTDPTNRRYTLATLTDDGLDLLRTAAPGHVAAVREIVLDRVSPAELAVLSSSARSVHAALDGRRPLT